MQENNFPNRDRILELIELDQPRVGFPTIRACTKCSGVIGLYNRGDTEKTPEEAVAIAFIQYGYYLAKWEKKSFNNKYNPPQPCICECNHVWETLSSKGFVKILRCSECDETISVDSSG